MRKALIAATLIAATLVDAAPFALAQDWPARPMTLVVPFAAGGGVDLSARIQAQRMGELLGQTIVVENVGAAAGMAGGQRVAKSPPDGYTFLIGNTGTHAFNQSLYKKPLYNAVEDFTPVGLVSESPRILLVRKDLPVNNVQEFVAYVKANAGKLNNAHAGVGSVAYTTCLLFNHLLGVKPTMIPYNGGAPALNALVAGQVDYMCDQIINGMAQVQSGQIKGYAIATPQRHPLLPDVPTTTEAGLPDYQASAWNAMFAPKGTPKPILARLNAAIVRALDDATVRRRLLEIGSDIPDVAGRTPEALANLVRSEIDKWAPIVKAAAAK